MDRRALQDCCITLATQPKVGPTVCLNTEASKSALVLYLVETKTLPRIEVIEEMLLGDEWLDEEIS